MDLDDAVLTARRLTEELIAPKAAELDATASWPEEGLRALLRAGLGGLVVPRSLGGLGLGLSALVRVCQAIGRDCPSTAICFGMHCVGSSVLSSNPTSSQIRQFIKPICDGEHITTLSLSEPGTGALFYLPQTEIIRQDSGDFLINGVKTFVTNGGHADSYVISGVERQLLDDTDEFSCYILPADTAGMEWGEDWSGLGMRGNSSRTLTLNDVALSADKLLGKQGEQIWYLFHAVMPHFLIAMAGTYLGLAMEAFEIGRSHLLQRTHSHNGRALAGNTLLQHKLAQIWSRLQMTEQLVYHAARRFDNGDEAAVPLVLATKAEVAETAVVVVNEVMSLVGGMGYAQSGKLGKMLRDVRAAHVMSPTTNLLNLWIGRILLEQPIFSDD